jgi:hypothetical protein
MCREAGIVAGEIKVDPTTQKGTCWLTIKNPPRAEEFILTACGEIAGLDELRKLNESGKENPWDMVPMTVKHRLEQWFRPDEDEHFLAYIPDRDHNRTEDGMAGVIVSDKRLIYHTHLRHKEMQADQPLQLLLAMKRGSGHVTITTKDWQIRKISVDQEGVRRLRRGLSLGKFKAKWG